MKFSRMLVDAYEYTRDALWNKWTRWLLLALGCIIFPFGLGYSMKVLRGETPAPEPESWGRLFVDGLLLFLIWILYWIPVWVVGVIFIGGSEMLRQSGGWSAVVTSLGSLLVGLVLIVVLEVLIWLVFAMAAVRYARTGSFAEAFDVGWIRRHIGRIGIASYVIALIVLFVAVNVVFYILAVIPIVGWLLLLALLPAFFIFIARYLVLVYDSVPDPEVC